MDELHIVGKKEAYSNAHHNLHQAECENMCSKNLRFWNIVLVCGICLVAFSYFFYRFSIDHSSNALEVGGKLSTLENILYRDRSASVIQLTEEVKQLKAMVISKKGIFDNTVKMGAVDYPVYVPTIFWKRRFLTIGVLSSASNLLNAL